MADQEHLSSRTPLLTVNNGALIRLWRFIIEEPQTGHRRRVWPTTLGFLQDQVGLGDDAISVFFRTALLKAMFHQGLLDDWRQGAELRHVVFDVAATFPMGNGVEGFDAAAFLDEVRSRATDSPG